MPSNAESTARFDCKKQFAPCVLCRHCRPKWRNCRSGRVKAACPSRLRRSWKACEHCFAAMSAMKGRRMSSSPSACICFVSLAYSATWTADLGSVQDVAQHLGPKTYTSFSSLDLLPLFCSCSKCIIVELDSLVLKCTVVGF